MAEPVGITGTAAGLVSLGLQLYSEISRYIDAVKGRKRDLDVARRHAGTLQDCLAAIDEAISSTNATSATSRDAVEACIIACKDELQNLESLVARLRGPTAPADTLSAKAREKGRQLMYPFQRESIVELEKTLASTNDVLQTALQALGINVSITIQSAVIDLKSDAAAIKVFVEDNSKQISELSNLVESTHTIATDSGRLIPEIHAQNSTTSLLVAQQTSQTTHMSMRVEENTQVIRQQSGQIERFGELLQQLVANSTVSQRAEQQFGQLVARPSDLRTLCDGFLSTRPSQSSTSNLAYAHHTPTAQRFSMGHPLCPCMRRRYVRRHGRSFGPLAFEIETSEIKHHAPECPLSKLMPPEKRTKRGFNLTVPGVKILLQKAIRFSLSLSTGAGGSTFSQNLSWVATVDPKLSPAFRISDIAIKAIKHMRFGDADGMSRVILESCWKRLFWCYTQNIASPTDVGENGASVLGRIVAEARWRESGSAILAVFIRSLMGLKLAVNDPLSKYDKEPIHAGIIRSKWFANGEAVGALVDALRVSIDSEEGYLGVQNSLRRVLNKFQMLRDFPELAKVLNFGPVMLGILQQDVETVSHLLKTNPASIFETDYYGQTPIHIAALTGNLSILKIVLSFSNMTLLNTMGSHTYYAIEYAMTKQAHKACHAERRSNCDGCTIVEAMLNAGSGLFSCVIQQGLGYDLSGETQNLSLPLRAILLRHLKQRRMMLQEVAVKHLPKNQRRSLTPAAGGVLDRNAAQVQKLLEGQSYYLPWSLRVYGNLEKTSVSCTQRTIYNYIWDKPTAQLAWKLGFRDVGINFTEEVIKRRHMLSDQDGEVCQRLHGYLSWLLDHGLDLTSHITETPPRVDPMQPRWPYWHGRTTSAHRYMSSLGSLVSRLRHRPPTRSKLSRNLSEKLFSPFVIDGCSCQCSPSGCTPLMKYFDSFRPKSWLRVSAIWISDMTLICRSVLRLIPRSELQRNGPYDWIWQAILRRITFDALSLSHTCCCLHTWNEQLDENHIAEICEICAKDKERLLLLENLCAEFEAKCGGNSKLVQFVRDTWEPRMISELKDLKRREKAARLTRKERLAAEEIGVSWDSDSSGSHSSESDSSESDSEEGTLEDYRRRLDEIVPEPDIQLPYGFKLT